MRIPFLLLILAFAVVPAAADPLPSWTNDKAKQSIVAFVEAVTTERGADFVPAPERIAVFDNDGTPGWNSPCTPSSPSRWTGSRPSLISTRSGRSSSPSRPRWRATRQALGEAGMEGLMTLLMASHAGMSTDAFAETATAWLDEARHPRFERPYTGLVYQPMLELLEYLRANGFSTYIVSGGGIAFLRPWTEEVYGIPPEQVVGSQIELEYSVEGDAPAILRKPEIAFIDDKAGKPVGIQRHIGRRPILAFGNSDGDYQMLQWTTAGEGKRLGLLLHHDDAAREYAYDRDGHVGKLDRGLDDAAENGWVIVSMKDDFATVFPEAPQGD
jgi:hypothetical protein